MYLEDARCQEGWLSGSLKNVQEKESKQECKFFLQVRCTRQMWVRIVHLHCSTVIRIRNLVTTKIARTRSAGDIYKSVFDNHC